MDDDKLHLCPHCGKEHLLYTDGSGKGPFYDKPSYICPCCYSTYCATNMEPGTPESENTPVVL